MPDLPRDSIHPTPAALEGDEKVVARFAADPATYWRSHAVMAVAGAVGAGVVLVLLGNPYPWTGPLAAILAVGLRALYLRSEALAESWRLTETRLLGPGGRIVPLSSLAGVKPFLGDLVLISRTGDKHLMKYLSDPAAVRARIDAARAGR